MSARLIFFFLKRQIFLTDSPARLANVQHQFPLDCWECPLSIFDLSRGLSFIWSVISQTSTHSISSYHRFVFSAQLNTSPLWLRWIQNLSDKNVSVKNERPVDIRNRPRIPVPDEDPYSVAGSGSSGSSGLRERSKDKPPKLPPRDSIYGPHNIPKVRVAVSCSAGPGRSARLTLSCMSRVKF